MHYDCFYLKRLKSDKVTEKGEIRQFIPVLHCVGVNLISLGRRAFMKINFLIR